MQCQETITYRSGIVKRCTLATHSHIVHEFNEVVEQPAEPSIDRDAADCLKDLFNL